jgi:MFS family permease
VLYLAMAAAVSASGCSPSGGRPPWRSGIPPHLLSRVSAWDWMGSLALLPVGYLLAGPLADRLGQQEVTVAGGLLGSLVMALALLPRSTRELERWDGPEVAVTVVQAPAAAVVP